MLDEFERYAVYWVPGRSDALMRFGTAWMGWCAEAGETRPQDAEARFPSRDSSLTRDVSRHGFHGVIRPPFRLAAGRSLWSIERALQALAETQVFLAIPRLEIAVVDGRVALIPSATDVAACEALSDAVTAVERAIAPLVHADDARAKPVDHGGRKAAGAGGGLRQLPPSGANRFHMPLTDRQELPIAFQIKEELQARLETMLGEPRRLGDLALMGDPGGGRPLRVLQRFDLRETPVRRATTALPCSGPQNLVQTDDDPMADAGIAV
jgi:hypothetical protein